MPGYTFPDEDSKAEGQTGTPEDDEIEISIVDDTPDRDKGRPALSEVVEDPTDDELKTYSEGVQTRIKKLTHARHDERRAKEVTMREKAELERMAQSLWEENAKLRKFADEGSKQIVASGQASAEAALVDARRQFKEAQESFDTDAIIAAQEAMTDAKIRFEESKKARPTALHREEDVVQPQQNQTRAPKPDDKTLRWQAKNQWFGSDGFEDVTSYALGLHQKLVKGGVDPSTVEYFEHIDARVKSKFPEVFGEEDKARSSDASKKRTSVVAPVARSTGVRKVQLTTTQVALAKKFGLSPQQYAAQVALLEN
jgi:hypothetical protein